MVAPQLNNGGVLFTIAALRCFYFPPAGNKSPLLNVIYTTESANDAVETRAVISIE